jgi:hypothetical protein
VALGTGRVDVGSVADLDESLDNASDSSDAELDLVVRSVLGVRRVLRRRKCQIGGGANEDGYARFRLLPRVLRVELWPIRSGR